MNELATTQESCKIDPESLAFVDVYLRHLDINETAEELNLSTTEVVDMLKKPEIKRFIDNVFIEQGYLNKFKLVSILDRIIESKLEEAEESGVYSGKDLVEILTLMHKIHMDHSKQNVPSTQTNVQVNNNYGNLGTLIERIVNG